CVRYSGAAAYYFDYW
nr:immunoglobulin heavy chain junction region [Macaca mulatta]MOW76876.1 immunoglobulin heavy chain junction region [Macaca mulatta]MOW77313.1 immunoglobulin heavy chain junction region [Macaca mulatta]MOW77709.1 immunoglobulin heavy chain junction region [Macaca mulatta]MOW79043.1 immunoglobulin heavy chain junction region [Macaca mulatta]